MKKKILTMGFIVSLLIGISTSVHAAGNNKGSGRASKPSCVTEPMSYMLLLAGGVSLAVFRRLKSRKSPKVLEKHSK